MKLLLALLFLSLCVRAQEGNNGSDDYFREDVLKYGNYNYNKGIRSIQLYMTGDALSLPVLQLGSGQTLTLEFDDLDADVKTYGYTFVHCNADWEPSTLMENEYMEGFYDNFISRYDGSRSTESRYTHYEVSFPNDNIRFTKSGNYLLLVNAEGNREKLILSRRFIIYQPLLGVKASVRPSSRPEYKSFKQEVDFVLDQSGYKVHNPFEIKVAILQNNRWDNAITDLKPAFINENEIIYDYENENSFFGGKEFRTLDLRTLRLKPERVESFMKDSVHKALLYPDEFRNYKRYSREDDINGRYLIKNFDGRYEDLDAEYVTCYFSLKAGAELPNGQVYLFGGLTDWELKQEWKMIYNPVQLRYECTAPLKQGYYNYQYLFLESGKKAGDVTEIEGMSAETENEYQIIIYFRGRNDIHDSIIGYAWATSRL